MKKTGLYITYRLAKYITIFIVLTLVISAAGITTSSAKILSLNDSPFVILDPGHGGDDPGSPPTYVAQNCGVPLDIKEKDRTLDIAERVRNYLLLSGVRVEMTRDTDTTVSLEERTDFINKRLPDLAISIHTNSAESCGDGVEAWYSSIGPSWRPNPNVKVSSELAQRLALKINQALGLRLRRDNGIDDIKGGYQLVREPVVPSALIETAFISNSTESLLLRDHPDIFALAITHAIVEQLAVMAPSVDVYMLVDLTGSFADDLPTFKAQAPQIISTLISANPNIRFGIGTFQDYPIYPFGSRMAGDNAYQRLIDLTFDSDLVLETIYGLFTRDGVDLPESQLTALYQAATGSGQDLSIWGYPEANIRYGQQANFRDNATKLFLLWTDASFHMPGDSGLLPYPGPSFQATVDAILALDPPKVIGISSGGGGYSDLRNIAAATNALAPSEGVDCNADGTIDIPSGEPLVCTISASGIGIGEAILALVVSASNDNLPPILSVPDNQVIQYSDYIRFNVSATDPKNNADTLTFTATNLPRSVSLHDNSDGTATVSGNVDVNPGTYTVEITVTNPDGLSDTKLVNITVNTEDARATFIGPMLISTSCSSCSTAVVPLRATIQDISAILDDPANDPYPGDITKATVTFVDRNKANTPLCTSGVILLDPANQTVGTASCNWNVNIGSIDGVEYNVGIVVNGFYTRNSPDDNTVVTVSKPLSNFITGGGFYINQKTGGTFAGDIGAKTNFGFNVKFNQKLTNLQGRVTILVRKGGHVYKITTNALTSLVVVPYNTSKPGSTGKTELVGKANILDVTDPLNPIAVEGGATLQMVLKDNGEPGIADLISFTLWSKNGKLIFSSNWDGVKTVPEILDGGNLQVH